MTKGEDTAGAASASLALSSSANCLVLSDQTKGSTHCAEPATPPPPPTAEISSSSSSESSIELQLSLRDSIV